MTTLQSWGAIGRHPHTLIELGRGADAAPALANHRPGIAHGMGRSYGDQALNPGGVAWRTTGLDRFMHFDATTGELHCEAGVRLADIQRIFVPRGWMLPVTPGTQWITVGGAIANDVHGKNHHRLGTFGEHVGGLRLLRTDGELIDCGPAARADWFAATVGGAGLTGLILDARLRLRKIAGPWLDAENIPFRSLDEFFALADSPDADWEHTVAWLDCLSPNGRGIFSRGKHLDAAADGHTAAPAAGPTVPPLPFCALNGLSLRLFNPSYFALQAAKGGRRRVHFQPFFYPLDALSDWNRLYGPRGFFQYQCVLPTTHGRDGIAALLREIADSGQGSFLAVLKTFGERPPVGLLSFPQGGVTLALDFPNRGAATAALFGRLDAIVGAAGGRLYLAKDARMDRALFEAGYPRLGEFVKYRDPGIQSAMSRRLLGS